MGSSRTVIETNGLLESCQAIIFDMDGTLVDSGKLHETAWIKTLQEFAIPVDRPLMRSLAGVSTLETLVHLMAHFDRTSEVPVEAMSAFKEGAVRENLTQCVRPTALESIVDRYLGLKPMSVGTGANTDEARMILDLCGLGERLSIVVGADQVANPKPAPDTFLRCADKMGVEAAGCVVLEDSALGLEAARNAGMSGIDVLQVFGVQNDYFL